MTEVSEAEFLNKLFEVVYKLSNIVKTQSYRFKKKWDEYLKPLNSKPHNVRQIPVDKEKFLNDIDYRISVLKNVEQSVVDGFHSIKSLLQTLYNHYFDSDLFKKDFSEDDQIILKYLVAKQILGNLIQYNKIDHESVPLKYNIIARNYTLIKLKGQKTSEIFESLEKLNIMNVKSATLNKIMNEIEADGIIKIKKKDKSNFYELNKELELSEDGKKQYGRSLQALIDWPTLFVRSFYNIRELNVTPDKDVKHRDFLITVLAKSATQGYAATHYVFKNLIKYYEMLKDEAS